MTPGVNIALLPALRYHTQKGMTMKRLSLFLLTIVLVACGFADGELVQGSGDLVSATRPAAAPFTAIVLANAGHATVVQGEPPSIQIEAEDNILPHLTTTIAGGTLTLATEPGVLIQPRETIHYTVTLPQIERLAIAGSGNIEGDDLVAEVLALEIGGSGDLLIPALTARTLTAEIGGSGNIAVGGEAQVQSIGIGGSGDYDALDLISREANVTIGGSGTVTLRVAAQLDVTIDGSGDVIYYGNPLVQQEINGSGELIQGSGR